MDQALKSLGLFMIISVFFLEKRRNKQREDKSPLQ